jgi:hypothetical protein
MDRLKTLIAETRGLRYNVPPWTCNRCSSPAVNPSKSRQCTFESRDFVMTLGNSLLSLLCGLWLSWQPQVYLGVVQFVHILETEAGWTVFSYLHHVIYNYMSICCSGFMSINICMSSCIATFQSCAIACILRRFRIKGKCSSVEAIVTQARETVLQPQTAIPHGTREALCSKTVFFVLQCVQPPAAIRKGRAIATTLRLSCAQPGPVVSPPLVEIPNSTDASQHFGLEIAARESWAGPTFFLAHFLPHRAPAVVSCPFWLPHFLKVARARSDKHILEQHGTLAFTTAWFCWPVFWIDACTPGNRNTSVTVGATILVKTEGLSYFHGSTRKFHRKKELRS